tara:strand:- start:20 stop:445 length:426 start_codon:yes stop_codon:yes gene_type:complete
MLSNNIIIRGTKRKCNSCGTLFFDFDKMPIVCPSCGASVSLQTNISKRGRPPKILKDELQNKPESQESIVNLVNTDTKTKEQKLDDEETEDQNILDTSSNSNLEIDENEILDDETLVTDEELAVESDEVENIIDIERNEEQ